MSENNFEIKLQAVLDKIKTITGIPAPVLSEFKAGRKMLHPESLQALNDYLDNH